LVFYANFGKSVEAGFGCAQRPVSAALNVQFRLRPTSGFVFSWRLHYFQKRSHPKITSGWLGLSNSPNKILIVMAAKTAVLFIVIVAKVNHCCL
jgi:hypothetical protein